MANENQNSSGFSIGLGGLCFITFIVFLILKLTNVIAWSWWWVTAPLWITPAIVLAIIFLLILIFLLIFLFGKL